MLTKILQVVSICILLCASSSAFALATQQDPTRPPSVIAQQLTPLQVNTGFNLSAVFTRNQQRYAVVNGEVLKNGDQIQGMRVSLIEDSGVVLSAINSSSDDIILKVQNDSGMSKQVVQ